jgi:hypothetical protein
MFCEYLSFCWLPYQVQMKTTKSILLLLSMTLVIPCVQANTNSEGYTGERAGRASGEELSQEIKDWFRQYDIVRRQSKMTLREKLQSRHLLTLALNPMALFSQDSDPLLKIMIDKYTTAREGMEKLPHVKETEDLRSGFLKYFTEARQLFKDSMEANDQNIDDNRRRVEDILKRKRDLEILDQKNKELDKHLRTIYHIPPLSQEFFK